MLTRAYSYVLILCCALYLRRDIICIVLYLWYVMIHRMSLLVIPVRPPPPVGVVADLSYYIHEMVGVGVRYSVLYILTYGVAAVAATVCCVLYCYSYYLLCYYSTVALLRVACYCCVLLILTQLLLLLLLVY